MPWYTTDDARRDAEDQQDADTAARDWLVSIGSEPDALGIDLEKQ